MKYVVVILDGAAGWPLDELDGRTTLEAARTPNLDALAEQGLVGLARTVPAGTEASSAAACTSILGYDPIADAVGRGAIEAASMGIVLAPDEVALRMNLVTIIDGVMVSYAGGHIDTASARTIVEDLDRELGSGESRLYPGIAYRHILVVKGHPELLEGSFTPPHDITGQPIEGRMPAGPGSGFLLGLMQRARRALPGSAANLARIAAGNLPVTDIWPFWPGAAPVGMVPFSARRGLRAAMTSGVDLLGGLAVLTGIDRLHVAGVTDGADNDYAGQAAGGLAALDDHDVVVVHVETPDEEGHAGNVAGKIAGIEAIDREVVGRVRELAGPMRILCMPDHPTPIALKTHTADPVPFVLAGDGVPRGTVDRFSERAAASTGLTVDPGRGVMDLLLGQ